MDIFQKKNRFQDTIQKQTQRKVEIESYQLLLNEVEAWLKGLNENVQEADCDESNIIEQIEKHQNNIQDLEKQKKKLAAIKSKCDSLSEHKDIQRLSLTLFDQLEKTIDVIQEQLNKSNDDLHGLEMHLMNLRVQSNTSTSENTLNSSPIPEIEMPELERRLEVETQTSESLQVLKFPKPADMVECSVQTKEIKSTENITVTQTQSEGHETIKFESTPNLNVEEYVENVLVDAKYKQPNEPNKSTELVLRNVPQTSFETIFVEPDHTTTEVVIDADGRKQIIVRKIKRTFEHQQVIELIKSDENLQTQKIPDNSSAFGIDNLPDNLVISSVKHEAIPEENQIESSIQTIVHHVTQRIVRRKRKIIRKVTIIDGKEHISEEVIEEPEEIEVSEDQVPTVDINVIHMHDIPDIRPPIIELPPDEELNKASVEEIVNEPMIISENISSDKENKGKQVRASRVKDEENSQVLDFEKHAPVDLVDNAQVVADSITTVSDMNNVKLTAKLIKMDSNIELEKNDDNNVIDIAEIWPQSQLPKVPIPHSNYDTKESEIVIFELPKDDSIPSEYIWPIDGKTGHVLQLDTYTFDQMPLSSENDILQEKHNLCDELEPNSELEQHLNTTNEQESHEEISVLNPVIEAIQSKSEVNLITQCTDSPEEQEQSKEDVGISQESPEPSTLETKSKTFSIEKYSKKKKRKRNNGKEKRKDSVELQVTRNETPGSVKLTEEDQEQPQGYDIQEFKDQKQDPEHDAKNEIYMVEHDQESILIATSLINEDNQEILSPFEGDSPGELQVEDSQTDIKLRAEDILSPQPKDLEIVIERCESEKSVGKCEDRLNESKTIDVRSVTQLFIDNELNVSDGTTRTVKLIMSPKESPSSPGSVTVKMKMNTPEQPRLSVSLIEEQIQSVGLSAAESVDLHISDDDNTISDQMAMPEIDATPILKETDEILMTSTEQLINPSSESYKSISELESPVKVVEESVISTSSDSPKPLGTEIIFVASVMEEQQTEDVEQQTEFLEPSTNVDDSKPVSSSRSIQTTPEQEKIFIDENLQTSPVREITNVDKEIQTSPAETTPQATEHMEIVGPIEKIDQEVIIFINLIHYGSCMKRSSRKFD